MRNKSVSVLFTGGILVVLAAGCLVAFQKTPALANGKDDGGAKHKADEQAIRKVSGEFSRALGAGDAKAVAGYWTEEGEYVHHDGTNLHGKPAIEEAYAKFLKDAPQAKVEMNIDSIRFVAQDTAIEEGNAKIEKDGSTRASRYSILYARENGQWRIALLREWVEGSASLRDIEWLIGDWMAKTDDAEVRTTYAWDENKKFIHVRFTIKGKDRTASGTQIIARDPSTDTLRSWLFESEGGFGSSTWSRQGKRWMLEATGVEADGTEITATNILTPVDKDSFVWQSVDRTAGGEEQPNIRPIKVTRVK